MSIVINTKKEVLSSLTCPTCGARVNYKSGDKTTMCMYCGNTLTISTVEETSYDDSSNFQGGGSPKQSIANRIDTSSSALAYINYFFDTFDWDGFAYGTEIKINELEELVDKMRISSADNYKTWVASFLVTTIPFIKKIQYRSSIFKNIIEEFKKDNIDSYGMYETYKKTGLIIKEKHTSVLKIANDYLSYANKYGIPKTELSPLNEKLNELEKCNVDENLHESITDIPEIKTFISERNKQIIKELKDKGLDAESLYQEALGNIEKKKYNAAIPSLYTLGNYKDSAILLSKISSACILNKEVFIQDNESYLVREKEGIRTLRDVTNKETARKVLATRLSEKFVSYGNLLLYFEAGSQYLVAYDLQEKREVFKSKKSFPNAKTLLLEDEGKFIVGNSNNIGAFDLVTFNFETLVDKMNVFYRFIDHYGFYSSKDNETTVIDLVTKESFIINRQGKDIVLVGDLNKGQLVYTLKNPNNNNLKLCLYDFNEKKKFVIESNIEGHCSVINGSLFYLVSDNKNIKYLIMRDNNCENRKEICSYVSKALFISGDYLYFIRSNRYNTALCKVNLVNSGKVITIATQIDEFIKVENGELYYVDDRSSLRKVRMNGSHDQLICSKVKSVVLVNSNQLVFQASDGENCDSLYAIRFNEEGHTKLAYNIDCSQLYDDEYAYYIKNINATSGAGVTLIKKTLCKVNLNTYVETIIFDITSQEPQSVSLALPIFLGIMSTIAFIVSIILFANNLTVGGVIFLIITIIFIAFLPVSIIRYKRIKEKNMDLI